MQQAAFQDLCYLVEAEGPQAWRRKLVFEKDNGEIWQQIGTICIDEVQCICLHVLQTPNEECASDRHM